MSNKERISISSRSSNPPNLSNLEVHVRDVPFSLSIEVVAKNSAKVAALLEKTSSKDDISAFLRNIPAMPNTFDLVLKFCYGHDVVISTDNVVPLAILACHLQMDEAHSKNNLIAKLITFFQHTVLPSWKDTIKALRSINGYLHQAKEIGLFDACLESIVEKARLDPRLLGQPNNEDNNNNNNNNTFRPNTRRKLFVLDCAEGEELTTLPLQIYEPIVHVMNLQGIPPEYVAGSVCKYAEKWILSRAEGEISAYKRNSMRETLEAIERLLPNEKGFVSCSMMFDLLKVSVLVGASLDCTSGFETRIGKQLDQASMSDLMMHFQNMSVECLKRILSCFYRNFNSSDPSGLVRVAQLVEEYLGQVASSDMNLGIASFVSLAELAVAASLGMQRDGDGIYRAIDIYLEKHKGLTEAEKEQVCEVLDCQKMSHEALQHAARNTRLPLRIVVQVLFVGQLQLREIQEKMEQKVREEEDQSELKTVNMKVSELERESLVMRKEIQKCHSHSVKKEMSVWKKMKRKFGCISNTSDLHEGYSRVNKTKVHPKHGVRHE